MQRIRIKFSKGPQVKFTSHLDMIRCFERAIRRADIMIAYSGGFNPRMQIAWGPPLQLGIESSCELADLSIDGWVKPQKISEALNGVLPKGFEVLEAELADPRARSLDSHINRAEYVAEFDREKIEGVRSRISEILARPELSFEKNGKAVDKRGMLHELSLDDGAPVLRIVAQVGGSGTLKPNEMLALFKGTEFRGLRRTRLFVA